MFRPCIDLHEGKVKQIVGGTISVDGTVARVNHVSPFPARHFAELYRRDGLKGGHVILLDRHPANQEQARAALAAYPGGLQLGGGVNADNAAAWLEAGASHIIVTSWVFHDGVFDASRLHALESAIGRSRLVLDLSCRRRDDAYCVVTDRWTRFTNLCLGPEVLDQLAQHCAEFLIHAVDVEGQCQGIDRLLVAQLAAWTPLPTTYAGGTRSLADLEDVERLSQGRIDLTIGSALDIFGGTGVAYAEVVAWNRRSQGPAAPGYR